MNKGISIHIGLNSIDPAKYNGKNGKLKNPENDAKAMRRIAYDLGYNATTILTETATAERVLAELSKAAKRLVPGDILLITYAGHGSQVSDLNEEESDFLDETWVLYDRMLLDDELYQAWSAFAPGVKIVVLSDSCHSGTVTRMLDTASVISSFYDDQQQFRFLAAEDAAVAFEKQLETYKTIKAAVPRDIENKINASVLLISGCQDNQLASDGINNGLFTAKLLSTWNNGTFAGNYYSFHATIVGKMPAVQTPNYFFIGAKNEAFENEIPFTIDARRQLAVMRQSNGIEKTAKIH